MEAIKLENGRRIEKERPWAAVLRKGIRRIIKDSLLGSDLESGAICEEIIGYIGEARATLLPEAMKVEEKIIEDPSFRGLTIFVRKELGLTTGDPIPAGNLEVSDEYISWIRERVNQMEDLLGKIEDCRAVPEMNEHIRPLIIEVDKFLSEGRLQDVYDLVCSKIGDPDFTPTTENIHGLSILMYLPNSLRYAVQHLLLLNYAVVRMEELREKYADDEVAQQTIEDVIQNTRSYQKNNGHWYNLVDEYNVELFDKSELLKQSLAEQDLVIELANRHTAHPNALSAFKDCMQALKSCQEAFNPYDDRLMYVAYTDAAHMCSYSGVRFDEKLVRECKQEHPKDGRTAVVLEDDSEQMRRWAAVVDSASPYVFRDGGQMNTSRDMEAWIDEGGEADLYMLDIENGEDREAGIRIAIKIINGLKAEIDQILEKHGLTIEQYNEASEDRSRIGQSQGLEAFKKEMLERRKTKIIIFSSSDQLVQKARKEVVKVTGEYSSFFGADGVGTSSTFDIGKIRIRAKRNFRFVDIVY